MRSNTSSPSSSPDALRRELRQRRRELGTREQLLASERLAHTLSRLPQFRQARRIAFYLPIDGEIDTSPLLLTALRARRQCFLPVVHPTNPQKLSFVRYTGDTVLYHNRWGIPEPRIYQHSLCPPWALDLVLVPLTGFDASGNRLGMGKGYYDRCFQFRSPGFHSRHGSRNRPLLIGVGHECQRVAGLQPSRWDVRMDMIVSDEGVYATG